MSDIITTTWEDIRETPASATPREVSAPRFIVKPASEMRDGEPSTSSWIPLGWTAENAFARVQMWCKGLNAGDRSLRHHWDGWMAKRGAHTPLWAIIDTHSPEWKAFDRDFGKAEYGVSYSSTPTLDLDAWEKVIVDKVVERKLAHLAGPPKAPLSDGEIVAVFEWETRAIDEVRAGRPKPPLPVNTIEEGDHWFVRDWYVDRTMFSPAWSRELKRKQAEAREV